MTPNDIIAQLGEFPGIEDAKLERYILECLRDMCFETWAYTEWLTQLTTAGTAEYSLSPSSSDNTILGIPHDAVQRQTVDTPNPSASDGTSGTLTPTNTYQYKVTARKDDYGETIPCAAVSHVCPAGGEIELDWDDIDEASSYYVYRNNGSGGTTFGYMNEVTSSAYSDDGTDTPDTSVTPPTKSNLVKEIAISNRSDMKRRDLYWRAREGDWIERIFYDHENQSILLDRIPETTNMAVQFEVALQPQDLPSTIPSVFDTVREAFVDFCKGRIHQHPSTKDAPYHSPQQANYYLARYRDKRNTIKLRKFQGFGGRMRLNFRRFA